jgi:hypothetical protein
MFYNMKSITFALDFSSGQIIVAVRHEVFVIKVKI